MRKEIYTRKFTMNEAVAKQNIITAIRKVCNLLQRRTGKKFHLSILPQDVVKQDGRKLSGLIATYDKDKRIRFDWKTSDTSATVTNVTFWFGMKMQPDVELEVGDLNLIQIIDALANVINNQTIGTIPLEEASVVSATKGAVSKEIADSINAWAESMGVDDKKLANTRISELYRTYQYWYNEVADQSLYRELNSGTFRNYLISYMQKYEITNIFMRTVVAIKAGKEKIVVTDEVEKKKFDDALFALSLQDSFDLAKRNVLSVIQGYKVATMLYGGAGLGKSEMVANLLYNQAKGKTIKYPKGGVDKPQDFVNYIVANNDPNTIIVLDDFDTPLKQYSKYEGILKAITDPRLRMLTWLSSKNAEPVEIIVKSRFIFITNLNRNKIPEPMFSRLTPVELTGSVSDTLDYIEQNLDKVFDEYPSITKDVKMEVLDFLRKYVKDIKRIDFRLFKECLTIRVTHPEDPSWKKYCMMLLRKI